jgi:hypothetical protein
MEMFIFKTAEDSGPIFFHKTNAGYPAIAQHANTITAQELHLQGFSK